MKKIFNFLCHRLVVGGFLIVLQVIILILMIFIFNDYFNYFYGICFILSIFALLIIINNNTNPSYKIAWIVPIITFPIFGGLFYLMFSGNHLTHREKKEVTNILNILSKHRPSDDKVMEKLNKENLLAYNQAYYISNNMDCSVYQGTKVTYLKDGTIYYENLVRELKKAKHFIFLEYYIIEEGYMWNSILEILKEKVKDGVDVRVIYDDMGSIFTLSKNYNLKLESFGIKCISFNRFVPFIRVRMNNRDHRKIAVIDGYVGFTGGINLADCYMNIKERFGYWKDNGVMLKGNSVYNLTLLFLASWDYSKGVREDYSKYHPSKHMERDYNEDSYVSPYGTNPLIGEATGENVYLNMISKATKYIYITTPYLIIDNEMITALVNASKSGIDVKIIIPGIPDKKTVYELAKSYYEILISGGVKIYEYTPGFIHAKTFVVDDVFATVGTVNLDYRSLYLHFECGCWIYNSKVIKDIKEDIMDALAHSHAVTMKECKNKHLWTRIKTAILRMFAPLM